MNYLRSPLCFAALGMIMACSEKIKTPNMTRLVRITPQQKKIIKESNPPPKEVSTVKIPPKAVVVPEEVSRPRPTPLAPNSPAPTSSTQLRSLLAMPDRDLRQSVVENARKLIGKPYVWDKSGPDAFDCSGFVHYVLQTSLSRLRFAPSYYLAPGLKERYPHQSSYYRDLLSSFRSFQFPDGPAVDCEDAENADINFSPKMVSTLPTILALLAPLRIKNL